LSERNYFAFNVAARKKSVFIADVGGFYREIYAETRDNFSTTRGF
jgi:hypothetical protein